MHPDEATTIFEANRTRLARIAYRMLGSMDEAEDIVQDAWIRWQRIDSEEIREPAALLTRIVTRLCLDTMKSARVRRETYIGNWLPEPIVEAEADLYSSDELTLTLMLALERLSPLERAAFLLHDVFGIALDEVATTINRDTRAVRQLAVRARKHVQAARPRYPVKREEGDRIARAFFTASQSGDIKALRTMLAENVVLHSDGGGKVQAFLKPIEGIERLLRLYSGLSRKTGVEPAILIRSTRIDGLPGFVSMERGLLQTTALAIEDGRITGIYMTRNPEKLNRIANTITACDPTPPLQ